jgi:hypothetical protein
MALASSGNKLNVVSTLMIAAGKITTSFNLALKTHLLRDLPLVKLERLVRVLELGDQESRHQPRHMSSRFLRRLEIRITQSTSSFLSQIMHLNFHLGHPQFSWTVKHLWRWTKNPS